MVREQEYWRKRCLLLATQCCAVSCEALNAIGHSLLTLCCNNRILHGRPVDGSSFSVIWRQQRIRLSVVKDILAFNVFRHSLVDEMRGNRYLYQSARRLKASKARQAATKSRNICDAPIQR